MDYNESLDQSFLALRWLSLPLALQSSSNHNLPFLLLKFLHHSETSTFYLLVTDGKKCFFDGMGERMVRRKIGLDINAGGLEEVGIAIDGHGGDGEDNGVNIDLMNTSLNLTLPLSHPSLPNGNRNTVTFDLFELSITQSSQAIFDHLIQPLLIISSSSISLLSSSSTSGSTSNINNDELEDRLDDETNTNNGAGGINNPQVLNSIQRVCQSKVGISKHQRVSLTTAITSSIPKPGCLKTPPGGKKTKHAHDDEDEDVEMQRSSESEIHQNDIFPLRTLGKQPQAAGSEIETERFHSPSGSGSREETGVGLISQEGLGGRAKGDHISLSASDSRDQGAFESFNEEDKGKGKGNEEDPNATEEEEESEEEKEKKELQPRPPPPKPQPTSRVASDSGSDIAAELPPRGDAAAATRRGKISPSRSPSPQPSRAIKRPARSQSSQSQSQPPSQSESSQTGRKRRPSPPRPLALGKRKSPTRSSSPEDDIDIDSAGPSVRPTGRIPRSRSQQAQDIKNKNKKGKGSGDDDGDDDEPPPPPKKDKKLSEEEEKIKAARAEKMKAIKEAKEAKEKREQRGEVKRKRKL